MHLSLTFLQLLYPLASRGIVLGKDVQWSFIVDDLWPDNEETNIEFYQIVACSFSTVICIYFH